MPYWDIKAACSSYLAIFVHLSCVLSFVDRDIPFRGGTKGINYTAVEHYFRMDNRQGVNNLSVQCHFNFRGNILEAYIDTLLVQFLYYFQILYSTFPLLSLNCNPEISLQFIYYAFDLF